MSYKIAQAGIQTEATVARMPTDRGGLATLAAGAVFSLGLILAIITGFELLSDSVAPEVLR